MTKIILPSSLNPISRRKDKSVKMSFETRELSPEETLTLMSMEGGEGWICFSTNEAELEVPEEKAVLDEKSPSERLRSVLFVWYKQLTEQNPPQYLGTFENFRREKMEWIIEQVKKRLE